MFFACTSSKCSATCGMDGEEPASCSIDVMDSHVYDSRTWQFCRIVLPSVKYTRQSRVMNYSIQCKGLRMDGHIPIAGGSEEWNLAAYSCYDQRRAIGERLWQEMSGMPGPRLQNQRYVESRMIPYGRVPAQRQCSAACLFITMRNLS